MSLLFKLLESQSNTLESIVLERSHLHQDDLEPEQVKFHQLTTICIRYCRILKRGLNVIIKADLPKLQQLKFEKTSVYHNEWILLQNKYLNQLVHSGEYFSDS